MTSLPEACPDSTSASLLRPCERVGLRDVRVEPPGSHQLGDAFEAAVDEHAAELHRLLPELFSGGARKFLSATQARALVATIKPRDIVGKTRHGSPSS